MIARCFFSKRSTLYSIGPHWSCLARFLARAGELRKLANEADGFTGAYDVDLRTIAGNTNVYTLVMRIDEAKKVLGDE